MKVSVSLPGEDVDFLDAHAHALGFESRSAVVHQAIRLLKASTLNSDYERAWAEWAATGEAEAWETTVDDGLPS